jgi:hypothetical protein
MDLETISPSILTIMILFYFGNNYGITGIANPHYFSFNQTNIFDKKILLAILLLINYLQY